MANKTLTVIIVLFAKLTVAQTDRVFNYSDSVFQEQSIHYLDVSYTFNHTRLILDSIMLADLDKLGSFIKQHPSMYFDVEHHTDSRGSDKYNIAISQNRAESLTRYLVRNYSIDSLKIRPIGYGELKPILSPEYVEQNISKFKNECMLETLHAINRRTLIRITKIEGH